jgi:hypothetical protein
LLPPLAASLAASLFASLVLSFFSSHRRGGIAGGLLIRLPRLLPSRLIGLPYAVLPTYAILNVPSELSRVAI